MAVEFPVEGARAAERLGAGLPVAENPQDLSGKHAHGLFRTDRRARGCTIRAGKAGHHMSEPCPDRLRISQRLSTAIQEVHRLWAEIQSAREKSIEQENLWIALQSARAEQRAAEHELQEHIDKHACQPQVQ